MRRLDGAQLVACPHPVSLNQSQLLTIHATDVTSAAYNIPMALWLDGPLEVSALRASIGEVVRRHAVLRTTYEVDAVAGGFMQRVHEWAASEMLLREASVQSETAAMELMAADAGRSFALLGEEAGVLRCMVVRVEAGVGTRHLLLVNVHHVAFDGASTALLLLEMGELYASVSRGGTLADAGLEEPGAQYVDYALWQRDELSPLLDSQCEYWRVQLREGALPVLELPVDFPRPVVLTFAGDTVPLQLPLGVMGQLEVVGRSHGCTRFQLMLAVWALLLCRHAGQDEVVVGTPYHGRDAEGTEGLIGYFVNMFALRVEVLRGSSVSVLLRRVRDAAAGAMRHSALPWQMVVHELLPRRAHDASRSAVYQTMLAWDEVSVRGVEGVGALFGASLTSEPLGRRAQQRVAKCELTLEATTSAAGGVEGEVEFNTDLFEAVSVQRLVARLSFTCEGLAAGGAAADADVWTVPMLPGQERALVLCGFNDTAAPFPTDACVHELVAAQTERTPVAVCARVGGCPDDVCRAGGMR